VAIIRLIEKRRSERKMIPKIALIICLINILLLTSCASLNSQNKWPLPPKPITKIVIFESVTEVKNPISGFYISVKQAADLANNIDELKAYIKKLELLIETINKEK
jgi:hypothetical protein